MTSMSNIRNEGGIIVGGNIENSTVSAAQQKTETGATDAELLDEINELLDELLKGVRQLPPEQRGTIRAEIVDVQTDLEAPDRDKQKIGARLGKLRSVLGSAVPLLELVNDVAELVKLIH